MLPLPTNTAPAARSRATATASSDGSRRQPFPPAVVGSPATSITSLMQSGIPSSGRVVAVAGRRLGRPGGRPGAVLVDEQVSAQLVVARADAVEHRVEQLHRRELAGPDRAPRIDERQLGGVHGGTSSRSSAGRLSARARTRAIPRASGSTSASLGAKPASSSIVRIWSALRLAIAEP